MDKKINPPKDSDEYQIARCNLALSFAPPTHACKKCKWPVITGYCCSYCGDTNPKSED